VPYNYVLTADLKHELWIIHHPDCPEVTKAREARAPLVTLLDCAKPVGESEGLVKHSCLPS
jgi:hypothetical protein